MVVQGEDDDFETCYTKAQSWIQTIHDRLQTCDQVQGSKEILEARLKETKEILAKEPEGSMWIHKVQVKADLLLDHTSEAKKHEIHQALREIKTTWEDTQTNMVHCHSRIEWVLLHWFEYLKAREDYFSWLVNMKRMLESDLELQLTLKEKKFQLSHHQTLLSSIFNQAALLERLLQESGSLFATTADESLNEKGQQELKASHEDLEQKAKQKVTVLEEIVQDHQLYLDSLEKLQNWLQLMTEKYNSCISHKNCKDHVDGSLQELMELSDSISSKEGELENLKSQAEAVIKNTSPKGAENINRDLEQLRTDWEDLQRKCERHQAPLQRALQNVLERQTRTQLLERELAEILDQLQTLELEPPDENEPEIVWRNCLITRSSILAVESRVEELQMKLKNLGMFSQNDTLSAQVLNVIQEFNRVKGKIMRRCSQLVENLRQSFQELLKEFKQWKNNTRNLLDSALDTNDEAFTSLYLQRIEDQLTCSSELQVKLDRFRVLEGMLTKVFNSEQAAAFGAELQEASWQQEFFTDLLIKRRGQIQANNQGLANYKLLMKKFEDWLKGEDQKLTNILAANNARNSRERKRRRQVLKVLNCHVPHGQKIFEELIGVECARVNEEEKQLEDLRYRWILYKTKLSEAGDLLSQGQDEVEEFGKPSGGICRYLSRACCAALPLQLLLLFLLLLAFLLPLIEEQDSCSVVNNFARSFYLMLRYQGPPPT